MNYKTVAMDDLRTHPRRLEALENLREKISALKAKSESIKGQVTDAVPVQGGACKTEERLINNLVERERLKLNYRAVKPLVDIVERGLLALDDEQKHVLLYFAENGRQNRGAYERLAQEMHIGVSTLYRIRDDALYTFTVSCYGIVDL